MPQPDPLGKYFAGSLGVHAALIGVVVLSGVWKLSKENWGSEHASSGSVGVTMVSTVPIPKNDAPENLLANDSQSNVPQAPAPVKPQPQVKAPEPKAIEIPDKVKRKVSPKEQSQSTYRPVQEYRPNQVYSKTAPALSSKMYGIQGSSGIDVGPASELGFRFGSYVDEMRRQISGKWNRAGVAASPAQKTGISFTISRNGSISGVKILSPSGSFTLDASAHRAVLDATPLNPLPSGFEKSEATVELWFQLKQ